MEYLYFFIKILCEFIKNILKVKLSIITLIYFGFKIISEKIIILKNILPIFNYFITQINYFFLLINNLFYSGLISYVSKKTETFITPSNNTFRIWSLIYFYLFIFNLFYSPLIINDLFLSDYFNLMLITKNYNLNIEWLSNFTDFVYSPIGQKEVLEEALKKLDILINKNLPKIMKALKSNKLKKLLELYLGWLRIAKVQNELIINTLNYKDNEKKQLDVIKSFLTKDNLIELELTNNEKGEKTEIELLAILWGLNGILDNINSNEKKNIDIDLELVETKNEIKDIISNLIKKVIKDYNKIQSNNETIISFEYQNDFIIFAKETSQKILN
tara:strand:- start:293 stop:1282 length:990 start_codon:yes stop_codon:yes gene_type:complete